MEGDANTQNYDNVTGPFTAIIWKETQIHSHIRRFEFSTNNMSVKILRSYAVTLLDLQKESSVNEGNTTSQLFSVKILQVIVPCESNHKNVLIPIQLNLNVIIF
jgi:hypothetical protein